MTADDNGTIDVGGYKVTLKADPANAGTVTCVETFENNIIVSASVTNPMWAFTGWIINGKKALEKNSLSYTVTEDTTIVAKFGRIQFYLVNTEASPKDAGKVTKPRLFETGEDVKVTAEPATGWVFVAWKEGDNVVSADAEYSFICESSRNLVAEFGRDLDYVKITATSNPTEGGTVEGGGYYKNGNTVGLTAGPAKGWKFTGWDEGGTVVSVDPQYSFTAETDRNLVANFAQLKYRVEFRNYDGFLLGGGDYWYGMIPEYTGKEPTRPADENYYYVFSGWDPALGPLTGQDETVTYKYKAQYTKYDRYVLTEGAGGQYVAGSGIPLELVFQPAAGDDPSAIEHFTGASVDGADLTEGTDFTVKAGSVVLELLPEYLDSLHAGQHTLTVSFDDWFKIDVDVNIVVPPPSNPKTGVSGNMGLYAGILIIAVLAAFGLIARRRKQNRMK